MQHEAPSGGSGEPGDGLVGRLRQATHSLHIQAERSGVIRDLLRGQASRHGYALLLRNLLPAYQRMETALGDQAEAPGIRLILRRQLERAGAIASDLEALYGSGWVTRLPLLPAGAAYADRIEATAAQDAGRLIAHAYVRYMGDLSGGQILRRILVRSLGLEPGALSLYDFPAIGDLDAFKDEYRQALDDAGSEVGDVAGVIDEGAEAFRLNIAVSEAVQAAALTATAE